MDSKTSEAEYSTPLAIVPRFPQEIVDWILDHLATDSRSLRSCALVSKSWVPSCQRHLFNTIAFTPENIPRWLKTFPVPGGNPARHVRELALLVGGYLSAPESFSKHTPWFTNVKRMFLYLLGRGGFQSSRGPLVLRLPQSVTSLTINANNDTLVRIWDILVQLPNLDDLKLSGSLAAVGRGPFPGIETALGWRFGGQLQLSEGLAHEDVMNMLLEIPTGLHFTEVKVHGTRDCLLSTARLAEACGETLVKLSNTVCFRCKSHPLSWPSWC